jgi:hypothetical protein
VTESTLFEGVRKLFAGEHRLGLISVKFVPKEKAIGPIDIVLNQTPFDLNLKHKLAPRGRVAIFVQPFDPERVFVTVVRIDPKAKFWNNVEHKRLVHLKHLLATVCAAVFRFFLAAEEDDFYGTDAERSACLKAVKTEPVTEVEFVSNNVFAPV